MEPVDYLDFNLKLEREGDEYTARVLLSPGGEGCDKFAMPFAEDRLELLVLKIGRPRTRTRHIFTAETDAAREFGGKLFEAVFGPEVRGCLSRSLDEVRLQKKTGLRIKLYLQDVAELADLPWEYLFDRSRDMFLAQSNQTPIVRYVEMTDRVSALAVDLPLKILVMISSPENFARLDVEREKALLKDKALAPLIEAGLVELTWLEEATLPELQRKLRGDKYHVFHYIGHGGFDAEAGEGVLLLEDEHGQGSSVDARRIGTLLHDHPTLRLAVLNSCEGARNSRTDPFAGVATRLVRLGIPAVIAMQFEITDDAAALFAGEFYRVLAEGFPVDAAVAEARKAIYLQPNDVEWGTPVLYLRSADGVLFNPQHLPVEAKTPPAARKARATGARKAKAPAAKAKRVPRARPPEPEAVEPAPEPPAAEAPPTKGGPVEPSAPQSKSAEVEPPAAARKPVVSAKFDAPHRGTVTYNDHKITVFDSGYGPETVHYDGNQVSRKFTLGGGVHLFRVVEDGAPVQYVVTLRGDAGTEIVRNGEIIYSNFNEDK